MKSIKVSKASEKKITITENDGSLSFLKGKDFFPEKTARAKEKLKNLTLPPL
jgi:hypothetical protein